MRQRRQPRGRQKRPSRSERARRPAQAVRRAERGISIALPARGTPPERVVAHLGPTNSGKTHAALEELAARGTGVYAGPLRMLAQEAHRRLGDRVGTENVGLITGEERVNERAPILCCTVEMAPQSGELLVLDEVQWADDEERGSAWTRLLLAGEYHEIFLLARSRRPSSRSSSESCRSSGSASGRSARWGRAPSSSRSAARPCSRWPAR